MFLQRKLGKPRQNPLILMFYYIWIIIDYASGDVSSVRFTLIGWEASRQSSLGVSRDPTAAMPSGASDLTRTQSSKRTTLNKVKDVTSHNAAAS